MMPLALIGPVEIAIVVAVGFLLFTVVCRGAHCAPGVVAKTLGVAAVVAGIGVLIAKNPHHETRTVFVGDEIDDVSFSDEFVRGDFLHEGPFGDAHAGRARTAIITHKNYSMLGVLTLLGSGLIILGAMLIGREKTRPLALKAVTWLGVGAILFSLVNLFSDTPRIPHGARAEVGRSDDGEVIRERARRPGRAKRPTLRPERPTEGRTSASDDLELPARAGQIPVEVELAKVEVAVPDQPTKEEAPASAEPEQQEAQETPAAKEQPAAPPSEQVPAADANASEVHTAAKPAAAAEPTTTASTPESPVIAPSSNAGVTGTVRPTWVDAPAGLTNGVYALVVNSGPYVSVPECQRALEESMLAAANHYINEYVGDDQAAALVNLSPAYLQKHIKRDEYAEVLQTKSVGAMHQLYARMEFDEKVRNDIQQAWRHAVVQHRLWYTAGGAALVLTLLATFYGYLKLDLKSSSAHRGQLQLAATLVALIVVAGALVARWAAPF
jgi:hypothetical protein